MSLSELLLFFVPGFPLLLAIPLLHRLLPRAEYFAILPAAVLIMLPENIFIETPWLLFGAGLGSSAESRLLLMMSVVLWGFAAFIHNTQVSRDSESKSDNYYSTYFFLTLSGHLGTILANGLVGFFAFSTLIGYGFYGLLVATGNDTAKKAGRIYISFIIVADLLLFEAALLAATVTEDMGFDAVRAAMVDSSVTGLYMTMVLISFALKAGFWPMHHWLFLTFRCARPSAAMLLAGVPVAMALLGTLRWLPLGEISVPGLGLLIQGMGGVAIMYTVLAVLMRRQHNHPAAYVTLTATGLFVIALGAIFTEPALWDLYASPMLYAIVLLGIGLALLTIAIRWLEAEEPNEKSLATVLLFGCWPEIVICWGRHMGFEVLPRLRNAFLAYVQSLWQVNFWQKTLQTGEHYLQRWSLAVTILLLIGITVVILLIIE